MGIRLDRGNPYKKRHDVETETTLYGTWKYFVENGKATLWDYEGDSSILILPTKLGETRLAVSETIPEDAFSSCEEVEYILCAQNTSFGKRVFVNCKRIQGIVSIKENVKIDLQTSSFLEPVFLSRLLPDSVTEGKGPNLLAEDVFETVLFGLAWHNDTDSLEVLIDYQSVGNAFRTAIFNGSVHTLKALRKMGFSLSDTSPFEFYLDDAVEQLDYRTLAFMIRSGCSRISDDFKQKWSFKLAEEKQKIIDLLFSAGASIDMLGIPVSEDCLNEHIGPVDGGDCEDGLKWRIDNVGVLTIEGSGTMTDYTQVPSKNGWCSSAPWGKYTPFIRAIKIGEGVASIGSFAFYHCPVLEQVLIGEKVQSIGDYAFYACAYLKTLLYLGTQPKIGKESFAFCDSLGKSIPSDS